MKIRKLYFGGGLILTVWGLSASLIIHVSALLPVSDYGETIPPIGLAIDLIPIVGIVLLVWKGIKNDAESKIAEDLNA